MNNKLAEKMAAVLKTIAHPDRLMIIKILTNGEKSVNKIVEGSATASRSPASISI